MKKIVLLIVIFLIFNSKELFSTHYMGGEITWECMTGNKYTAAQQGRYRFHLKLYRECYTVAGSAAATFGTTETLYTTDTLVPSISMSLKAGWPKDISPSCYSTDLRLKCLGMTNGAANMGAVQEYYYTSDVAFPDGVQLLGTPPASGWMFYNETCCRNPCTSIVNAASIGYRLRAIMYPYNNQNTYPCFDNSPQFAEVPITVICTGYPFQYNHNGFDADLDSLNYSFGKLLDNAGNDVTGYAAGYNYLNPLPGTAQFVNNVPASINPINGEIAYTSHTSGAFVTSTKVTSYKCGIKVGEIWRDMQIVLVPCGTNSQPIVTAPFPNNSYSQTVYAGDTVKFSMSATDFQFNANMSPQVVKLEASGPQFGSFVASNPPYFSGTVGCLNPPCATLTPAPGPNAPIQAQFAVSTLFSWLTDCQHLTNNVGCGNTSRLYKFVIKATDDYCPAPAIKLNTISITVVPKPVVLSPNINCSEVFPNGSIGLSWVPAVDSMKNFVKYVIYTSNSKFGPYIPLDSFNSVHMNNHFDINSNGNIQSVYYYLKTISDVCVSYGESSNSDTISSIFLEVKAGLVNAELKWNAVNTNNSNPNKYKIFRKENTQIWTLIDSTSNTFYLDNLLTNNHPLAYRIEQLNANGIDTLTNIPIICNSISNAAVFSANSIDFNGQDEEILVYPNPFTEAFNIKFNPDYFQEEKEIKLYSSDGRLILHEKVNNEKDYTISKSLNRGVYLLSITTSHKNVITKRLVKL